MGERKLLEEEMLRPGRTLFRNDNGTAWVGGREMVAKQDGVVKVKKGDRVVIGASRLSYGLQKGSGDLLGWEEVKITPDMVGMTVAVFCSVEVKTENDGISRQQILWHLNVLKAGGLSYVVKEGQALNMDEILKLPRRPDPRAAELDKAIARIEWV